ncbi:hypothetical protein [Janthinobacterium sp. 17J80-10]|uniref:hypothetical protein n=1 Tax=Janthinobacterium sp. 17J80-10 TaxID=2497863 RepID=UPI00100578AD|nr:hypothetical protein [Janthinobacterium sp. 17J80-10]QAU33407.1 hypothetical protein EKL02_03970 [Janthinobacterium sp. 17J80-10]
MNAKKMIVAVVAATCAAGAFAADVVRLEFASSPAPYDVTAQDTGSSAGAGGEARSAGAGISEQSLPAMNFANSLEPSAVTAQSPAIALPRK